MDGTGSAAAEAKSPFTVMIKPVGSLCNMSCSYCYYKDKDSGNKDRVMPLYILEELTKQYIGVCGSREVSFVWHGGEPTLAGMDFYKQAVDLQKKYQKDGWNCWNNLQTNGLLLDDGWCRFLSENKFSVGVSIDGVEAVHNKNRSGINGEDTYLRVAEGIERLKSYGIKPDLLCTVNRDSVKYPLQVYRGLKSFNTGWIQFIPIVNIKNGTECNNSVSAYEFGKFLSDVFDEWVVNDLDRVNIQFFAEVLRVSSGGSAGVCFMAPECGRSLVVDKDGTVYSCDHFVDSEHLLGNILNEPLLTISEKEKQREFGEIKHKDLNSDCLSCRWLRFCNGGCPKDRVIKSKQNEVFLCEGYASFFAYTEPVIKIITALRSKQKSLSEIKETIRSELHTIWKGTGRNDPCPCGSGKKAKNCCWYKRI